MATFNNYMKKVIDNASEKAYQIMSGDTFYTDEQGLKHCSVCKRKVETLISIPNLGIINKKVNCVCDCKAEQRKKYHEELKRLERQAELGNLQSDAGMKTALRTMTFDKDDSPRSYVSATLRAWAERFTAGYKWLFVYGNCGTGKTFYAACIANAMLLKGYSVKFATLADIEAELFNCKDKAEIYNRLATVDILVLDDMLSDRMTDYTYEILFKVIDDRYKNGGTMIITTNMTDEETTNPKTRQMERIMSRLWDKAVPVKCDGLDRRKANSAWR